MVQCVSGAQHGLRLSLCGLAALVAFVSITTDPADARSRRKTYKHRVQATAVYNPPYSAIVVDANTGGMLHSANPDALRHPASLTKIMTLYLLFERLEEGKIKLSTPFEVSAHAAAQAPSKLGLRPGQTLSAEDAIRALVTKSANDAAVVVAEAIGDDEDDFAAMMTRKARALGMSKTVYRNASGLPNDEQVTTARDQATLGRAIQERFPKYYTYFATPQFTYAGRAMRNHNRLLGNVEGVDGIKTGYTRASGFNLVTSVRRGGRHIVSVVLGGRSGGARDARMRELIGANIMTASLKRTVTQIAEAAPTPAQTPAAAKANETPKAPLQLASAAAISPRADNTTTAAIPTPGSTDPLRPLLVKTLTVRPGSVQTVGLAPLPAAPKTGQAFREIPKPDLVRAEIVKTEIVKAELPKVETAKPAKGILVPVAKTLTNAIVGTASAAEAPQTKPASHAGWIIQVGAFPDEEEAKKKLSAVRSTAASLLSSADPFTESVTKGDKTLYRARFAGLDRDKAEAACRYLKRNEVACLPIKN